MGANSMNAEPVTITRGRPRSPDMDDRIAEAVWALLSEVPYEEVTFERVAERAGCSRPAIYRRHSSKQSMVLTVINRLLRRIEPAIGPHITGRQAIIEHLNAFVRFINSGGRRATLSLAQAKMSDPLLSAAMTELRLRETEYYVDALKIACGSQFNPEICDLALDSIIGAVFYRCVLRDDVILPGEIEQLADFAILIARGRTSRRK